MDSIGKSTVVEDMVKQLDITTWVEIKGGRVEELPEKTADFIIGRAVTAPAHIL